MVYVMMAVKDHALGAFMRPFFAPNVATAKRSFGDEVNRKDSEMGLHPEDYSLHYLGDWDDGTAEFREHEGCECVVRGKDVFKEPVS